MYSPSASVGGRSTSSNRTTRAWISGCWGLKNFGRRNSSTWPAIFRNRRGVEGLGEAAMLMVADCLTRRRLRLHWKMSETPKPIWQERHGRRWIGYYFLYGQCSSRIGLQGLISRVPMSMLILTSLWFSLQTPHREEVLVVPVTLDHFDHGSNPWEVVSSGRTLEKESARVSN